MQGDTRALISNPWCRKLNQFPFEALLVRDSYWYKTGWYTQPGMFILQIWSDSIWYMWFRLDLPRIICHNYFKNKNFMKWDKLFFCFDQLMQDVLYVHFATYYFYSTLKLAFLISQAYNLSHFSSVSYFP